MAPGGPRHTSRCAGAEANSSHGPRLMSVATSGRVRVAFDQGDDLARPGTLVLPLNALILASPGQRRSRLSSAPMALAAPRRVGFRYGQTWQLSPAFRGCALSSRPCGGCRHTLDDRHVAPVFHGLINTLSVTGAILASMEEPPAHGHKDGGADLQASRGGPDIGPSGGAGCSSGPLAHGQCHAAQRRHGSRNSDQPQATVELEH